MNPINVNVYDVTVGHLFYEQEQHQYGFNYTLNTQPISLIMPYKPSSYIWKHKLHPIFDMHIPEGYLFEIFKNYLSKTHGTINDYTLFSYLCPNIQSRLTFDNGASEKVFETFSLDDVLRNDSLDTFGKIVTAFLEKNAISGIQPKSLAVLKEKESLSSKEYIIKTWGDEFPQLALNEYFSLKAVEAAGVRIPKVMLSDTNRFLIVERFDYDLQQDRFFGFEEILGLLGKNRDEKYNGSYEQVAKTLYSVTTDKKGSMESLFKVIVMNYLLKNGDAHLKNFGILYTHDLSSVVFAPAYDIVTTTAYFHKDRPALAMHGKKVWFGKKELIKFGIQSCMLSLFEATHHYECCMEALKKSIATVRHYIDANIEFQAVGQKMIDSWSLSLDQNTYKEIPDEITRNWR